MSPIKMKETRDRTGVEKNFNFKHRYFNNGIKVTIRQENIFNNGISLEDCVTNRDTINCRIFP